MNADKCSYPTETEEVRTVILGKSTALHIEFSEGFVTSVLMTLRLAAVKVIISASSHPNATSAIFLCCRNFGGGCGITKVFWFPSGFHTGMLSLVYI